MFPSYGLALEMFNALTSFGANVILELSMKLVIGAGKISTVTLCYELATINMKSPVIKIFFII